MDQNDKDFLNLKGETMALQVLVVALARQMARVDRQSVQVAFDGAANLVENFAFQLGEKGSADHIGYALRVIEELRTAALK